MACIKDALTVSMDEFGARISQLVADSAQLSTMAAAAVKETNNFDEIAQIAAKAGDAAQQLAIAAETITAFHATLSKVRAPSPKSVGLTMY